MEVRCQHCKVKLNIPDEKLPKGQLVSINCPKCKQKFIVDTRIKVEKEVPSPPEKEPPKSAPSEDDLYTYEDYSEDESIEFFEEDAKLALVMDSNSEHLEKIKGAVETLGYKFIQSPNVRDAMGKLRFHHFDLLILSNGFDGTDLDDSPIMRYLNHISISVRRKMFLTLLDSRFKTMDNMMAFARSANLVVNEKDIDKLEPILKKAIADHERFYKVFFDTLVETGKA
jgi:CheY-like chemotaxis protein/DNA-directed RNA polymerase subunit RPC12/RpoP